MVRCEICQKEFKRITHFHTENMHGVTLAEYRELFPSTNLESVEYRKSQSESHLGQPAWNAGLNKYNDSRVEKYADSLAGREFTPEHCQRISEAKVGSCSMAGWNKGMKMEFSLARAEAISKALTGREITWGDKISITKKEQFKDPEFAKRMVANITAHASSKKPNIPEQMVMAILDACFPNQWKYVGNGGTEFGGLMPDFINIDGKKQLIEMFGDYWHRDENPQDRIDHFKQFGFSTLVIWERELKNPEKVEEKIVSFSSVETLHEPSHVEEEKVRHS